MIDYIIGICSDNADIAQLQKKGKQAEKKSTFAHTVVILGFVN